LIQNLLNGLSTFDTKPSWGLKRDTEPGIWRFVLGALATFSWAFSRLLYKKTSPPWNFASIYKKRNPKSVENEKS
jgi:hypothetical protein